MTNLISNTADSMESCDNIFTELQKKAVEKCLQLDIPFAIFADPDDISFTFLAGTSLTSSPKKDSSDQHDIKEESEKDNADRKKYEAFIIGFFDNEEIPIAITGSISINEVLSMTGFDTSIYDNHIIPAEKSTNRIIYNAQIFTIKNRLKAIKGGGKVVLSRVIVIKSKKSPVDVAEEYFRRNPKSFRAFYFHPETGMWIVATPELLLDYHKESHYLSTMALAGTRKAGTEGEWDRKNIQEHKMVIKYIVDTLRQHEIPCTFPDQPSTLKMGNIEHLYTPIQAISDISQPKITELLKALSPTPAVGGYPKEFALELIDRLELHNRYCYSGWIGYESNDNIKLFVNLRSTLVTVSGDIEDNTPLYLYNIYAGGGILNQSDANTEWEETDLKSHILRNIIAGEEQL